MKTRACQRAAAVLARLGHRAASARVGASWVDRPPQDALGAALGALLLLVACGDPGGGPEALIPAISAGTGGSLGVSQPPGTDSGPVSEGGASGSLAAGGASGSAAGSGEGSPPASGGAPTEPPIASAGTGSTGNPSVFSGEELCSMFAVDEGGALVIAACSDTVRSVDKVTLEQINGGEWYSIAYGFEAPCHELGTYRGEVSGIRYDESGSITAYAFFVRSQAGAEFRGSVAIGYEAQRIAQVTGIVEGTTCQLAVCARAECGVLDPTKTSTTSGSGEGGAGGSAGGGGITSTGGIGGGGAAGIGTGGTSSGGAAGAPSAAGAGGGPFGQGGQGGFVPGLPPGGGTGFPGGPGAVP